jgi:hypothetical protein
LGTVLRSHLADWELDKDTFYIPETIQKSDVIILVGGFEGVLRAANWARIAGKPLLPFTGFGGAARRVYEKELEGFEGKYASLVDQLEYEQLNSVKDNWDEHANDIVALAEKVAMSRKVVAIMSYADDLDLEDVYESFKDVTADLGYRCERVTHENAGSRIVPDILDRIRGAAFTIVDITHLRPNVFYELGYADGLGKKVVVTAKDGTEPPFDISDIPTIFWKNQKGLKVDLRARILQVVPTALPKATPPLGPR